MALISSEVLAAQNSSNTTPEGEVNAFTETRQPNLISSSVTGISGLQSFPSGSTPSEAPAKADAATNATGTLTGLMANLNKFEQELCSSGTFTIPNEYVIEFAPATMASSKVVKSGNVEKGFTPMAPPAQPDQIDPDKQSMNTKQRTWSADAGTPIVQFIDMVMRNSSYIYDQARYIIDEVTQEVKEQKELKTLAWYKINVNATRKEFDAKRQDYAYKITFVISPYNVNNSYSQYYPSGGFRGVHKSYNYWFTGQNTEILNFEQDFNALFHQTLSNPKIVTWAQDTFNNKLLAPRMYQTRSQQSDQGAEGSTNDPSASFAETLYSPADQGQVKLKIVGDPAWLQQGEAAGMISAKTFTWSPFLADGTINFDAAQILFDVSFNQPVDYNLQTGIMDTAANNINANRSAGQAGDARQNYTYRATTVTSYFRQGKFEQDVVGVLFPLPKSAAKAGESRPGSTGTPPLTSPAGDGSGSLVAQASVGQGVLAAQAASTGGDADTIAAVNNFTNTRQPNLLSPSVAQAQSSGLATTSPSYTDPMGTTDSATIIQAEAPVPASPAEAPTSNGDVQFNQPTRLSQAVTDMQLSTNSQVINREA